MSRRKRTPAEIAEAMKAKAAASEARARMYEAKSNPVLKPLLDVLKRAQTRLGQLNRSFADTNPNSFQHRIRAFEIRLDEIAAAEKLAEAQLDDTTTLVETLRNDIENLSSRIANGDSISDEDINLMAQSYGYSEFPELQNAYDAAHLARKSYKASVEDTMPGMIESAPAMNAAAE